MTRRARVPGPVPVPVSVPVPDPDPDSVPGQVLRGCRKITCGASEEIVAEEGMNSRKEK